MGLEQHRTGEREERGTGERRESGAGEERVGSGAGEERMGSGAGEERRGRREVRAVLWLEAPPQGHTECERRD